jgi:hypothetical protein
MGTGRRSASGRGSRTCLTCWRRWSASIRKAVSGRTLPGQEHWSGPRDDKEAGIWLSGQQQGWDHGDWLAFAVLDMANDQAVGHVGLRNRDGGLVGTGERGEISYWTAAGAAVAVSRLPRSGQ